MLGVDAASTQPKIVSLLDNRVANINNFVYIASRDEQ
jgi:hypothetical protein